MKRIILLFLFAFLIIPTVVNADIINSVDMSIYINNSGDAKVTEVWDTLTTNKTEQYTQPYYNIGKSTIKNLKVSDDNFTYENLSLWDNDASLDEKRYKCGLNYVNNGVEICWGKGNYGPVTYKVEYEITNFVTDLKDSQMVYWTLIPERDDWISNANIEIKGDFSSEEILDAWGYGSDVWPCFVYDGLIAIKTGQNDSVSSDENIKVLAKFPKGTFNTDNKVDKKFNYYLLGAKLGSLNIKWIDIFLGIIITAIFGVVITQIILFKLRIIYTSIPKEHLEKIKQAELYRDIPCDGDVFKAYYIATYFGISSYDKNILVILLLKWLKEKKISMIKKNDSVSDEEYCIRFNLEDQKFISQESIWEESERTFNNYSFSDKNNDELEEKIFESLIQASQDGMLEKKELVKWSELNSFFMIGWIKTFMENEEKELLKMNYLYKVKKGKIFKLDVTKYSDDFLNEAIKLSGLKKYLKDYTLIDDKSFIEVEIFEEYLMFAQIFGLTKEVMKDFKKIDPSLIFFY